LLFIGDTSLLHDLNSLALVAKSSVPVKIFVLNNNGGAIFGMLPAENEPAFNEFFLMPHNQSFSGAATQFGLDYFKVLNSQLLCEVVPVVFKQPRSVIVECVISQGDGVKQIKELLNDFRSQGRPNHADN